MNGFLDSIKEGIKEFEEIVEETIEEVVEKIEDTIISIFEPSLDDCTVDDHQATGIIFTKIESEPVIINITPSNSIDGIISEISSVEVLSEPLEPIKNEKLYVVTCISNPENYKSRYRLYNDFKKYMLKHDNVILITVELAIGDQEFAVTSNDDSNNIQLRCDQVLWHKENLLNIGIAKCPVGSKVAWIDADISFANPNWVDETLVALNTNDVVQMFGESMDLDPKHHNMGSRLGFVAGYKKNKYTQVGKYDNPYFGATGYAWAANKDYLKSTGGLLDWCIIGSSDWHMAYAWIGLGVESVGKWATDSYKKELRYYQDVCSGVRLGYVNGLLLHYFHGKKSLRGYDWRWDVLKNNYFDPIEDLYKNEDSLIMVKDSKPELLEGIKAYFKSRKEDSTEV